ncbi:MAG: type II toxin-antitoxin system RelE/ParE family toxin [Chloracidobacterium sp.]|nr:type II toxin-antitoxin system RelE/ParE family toxin [Chloracidobacterium sp.]
MDYLQFTETPRFVKNASKLIDDDEIAKLQLKISEYPEGGVVVPNSGGMRKMRWGSSGRGKRGGMRIIYFLRLSVGRVLLLDIFSKGEKSDLDSKELEDLRQDVALWLKRK